MTDSQNMPNVIIDYDKIRAYIRALMAKNKVSVAKLAEITKIAKGTLDNFFDGTTKSPTFDKICTIIIALGGSVDEALGVKPKASPEQTVMDLSVLTASHNNTIKAKDDYILDLRKALAEERKKIKRLMWWQRVLVAENLLIAFIFILDFYNHNWGYFRDSVFSMLFGPAGGKNIIYKG